MSVGPGRGSGADQEPISFIQNRITDMQRKVQAGGLGGAVTVVIVWLLGAIANVDVPAEVASAFTVIISTGLAYAVKETK